MMWRRAAILPRRPAARLSLASQWKQAHGSVVFGCTRAMSSDVEGSAARLLQRVGLDRLAHQSRLKLQIPDATSTSIRVIPSLMQSDFGVSVSCSSSSGDTSSVGDVFTVREVLDDSASHVSVDPVKAVELIKEASVPAGLSDIAVEITVPHLIDLEISAVRGSVTVLDKIEGNVAISLGDGDIHVNKARGQLIHLKTNRGRIRVRALVEGERVKLAASALNVKRVMAGATEIKLAKNGAASESNHSELGAIYSAHCMVHALSGGSLSIGNIHGFLRVVGEDMSRIQVNSINGGAHIEDSGADCHVEAHFDGWHEDASNKIFVGGDVRVSLEPSAPIHVELHGRRIATNACSLQDQELDQLDDDYAIVTGAVQPASSSGPTSSSPSPSSSSTSGKINVGSAKNAALRTSFFAGGETEPVSSSLSPLASTNADDDNKSLPSLPRLVVHASNGDVSIEQLDWMAQLKRKHLAK